MQIRPTQVRLVRLNIGLSMYLDRTFSCTFAESKLRSKPEVWTRRNGLAKSLHLLFKSVLRPNFSSAKWLSKRLSQKVKSPIVSSLMFVTFLLQ